MPKNCLALTTWLQLATVISCWSWTFHRSGWSVITNRWALCWCTTRIGPWTTPVCYFCYASGKLISSYHISYHQFADYTQLYIAIKSLGPLSLAVCSLPVWMPWLIGTSGRTCYSTQSKQKQEALVTCTTQQVAKHDRTGGIPVFGVDVPFVSKLRILGVTLNCHLSFDYHITCVVRVFDYHIIRALRHIRSLINREIANICMFSCWHEAGYYNSVLYGVSHRIEHRSSPASSEYTVAQCLYHTIPCTYSCFTKVTSMASDQAADHVQDSDAHIQGTDSWTTSLPCRSMSLLTTHLVKHCVPAARIYSSSPVQHAICRGAFRITAPLTMERPANSHTVGHFCKQLPEQFKTHLFDIVYN